MKPDVTDYNVTVAEDVTKILVKGVTSDENSFYTVSGNTNLVKGKNEIVVTVTDKDGNIGHYYIHVQVGEQKEQTSQSDSQPQTNQAAQSVSESVAKPGDENELLSNTVNEFQTFAETDYLRKSSICHIWRARMRCTGSCFVGCSLY